jgi:spermidine synthase
MYHVIGTGITAILLYLLSYFFYRINYYSYQFHKKLWNAILAIVFIVTSAAGLFMALQVTYKWDIPFVKKILRWHVEFGIGMAFAGLFHFIWHLSYFARIFEKQKKKLPDPEIKGISRERISLNLFIIGITSSSVQLLMLREMLNISGGYELVIGIFLGSWLIGSSVGALLAGTSGLTDLRKINLTFSLSPLFSIALMLFLSRMFLTTGESPSFFVSLLFTLLVLVPYCMVSGFTFVKLIHLARSRNDFTPGRSFSVETIGGVAAGILISVLTSGILDTYQLLLLIMLLTLTWVLLSFYLESRNAGLALKFISLLAASVIIVTSPDVFFRQILLPGIKVTETEDTPYGNITKGEYKGEKSTYYNQRLLLYNYDVIEREENIHYAMLNCDSPKSVILISGSLTSQLPEILKYNVKEVTFLERDPALSKAWAHPTDTLPIRLSVINTDAFRYIRTEGGSADAIILSVPPPSTLQLNRYYTTEFFDAVKKKLNCGGVFMCSPGTGSDYLNKESVDLFSSVYNSLSSVFRYVKPVLGLKLYFVASDTQISVDYCRLAGLKHINNFYVGPDYLSDDLIERKSEEITHLMDRTARENTLAYPVAAYHFQAYSFSKDEDEKRPLIIALLILFVTPLFLVRKRNIIMYFSASALAGYEIIMLLTLQIIIGNMYQLSGMVIAGLMAGLATGSGTKRRSLPPYVMAILLILFYGATGLFFRQITGIRYDIAALVIIMTAVFIPAMLTGRIFRELTESGNGITDRSSSVYSADLAGSALGFILISGIAIPFLGIRTSIMILAVMIIIGLIFGSIRNK